MDDLRVWVERCPIMKLARLYADVDIDGVINSEDDDIDGDGVYIGLQCALGAMMMIQILMEMVF